MRNSPLILILAYNCFARARRMVEGTHPPTQNLNEAAGKAVSHPLTQCGQWQMTTYSNKTKTPEDGEGAGLREFKL